MNNVEKADYLQVGICDLEKAIANNDPLLVPKIMSLRVRLKKVVDGTRASEIYEELADSFIPKGEGFRGEDLSAIADAIRISPYPSLIDVFKVALLEKDLGL